MQQSRKPSALNIFKSLDMLTWKVRSQGSKALLGENCFEKCPGLSPWLWRCSAAFPELSWAHSHYVLLEESFTFSVSGVSAALPLSCCAAVVNILFLITLLGPIYNLKTKKKRLVLHLAGLCGFQVLGFALPLSVGLFHVMFNFKFKSHIWGKNSNLPHWMTLS